MKNHKLYILLGVFLFLVLIGITLSSTYKIPLTPFQKSQENASKKIIVGSFDETKLKSDEEWKKILSADQYKILREEGTETPFTGELLDNKEKGFYVSAGCNVPVFSSEHKYDSKTGWPSFYQAINEDAVVLREDYSLGYKRIEVLDKCGGHLGHVFDDGPEPTGKRFCINSDALIFMKDPEG